MIEKIKKRKENNFSISHAEQHHRKKGKDKNKRKKNNSFKNIEYMDINPLEENFFFNSYENVNDLQEKIFNGEEIKLFDVNTVKKVLKNRKFVNKIGSYQFDDGLILEILTYFDNKKVFLIRKG